MSSNNPLVQSSETKKDSPALETTEISAKTRKSSFFLNPTADSSNELIQLLLSELKEMRMEMKEDGKENKKRLEVIGENQKKLQEEVLKIQNDVTGIKKDLVEVKTNQGRILHKSNVNEIKKEPDSYSETDIRRQINGRWRHVNDHNSYFSAKFEGDTFMQKWNRCNSYDKYRLGVKHSEGWTVTVENNKIVQSYFTDQGEEYGRFEFYIENERLQRECFINGEKDWKYTFERYANPDPE